VVNTKGPVYVRMLRGEVPRLFPKNKTFIPDKARQLSRGDDLTLLSSGICTQEAMRATAVLRNKGVTINHLHISTHKPFTDPLVLAAISAPRCGVITMENHSIIGGLGSAVAELMAENAIPKRLVRIGLQDTFAHGGSRSYLLRYYGLDAMALAEKIEGLLGEKLGITESDLTAVRLKPAYNKANEEDL
jgi:transketolase